MRKTAEPAVGKMGDYVELHRSFRDVIKDNTFPNEDDVAESYAAYGKVLKDYALTWGDLLQKDAVVVLGEAGSGKSYEFRHQAAKLEREGIAAFFIELDRLATSPFEQTLSRESRQRFEKWRRGKAIGYFFLDAVDESKLHKAQDFYRALDALSDQLPFPARRRSRFCISSRITGWNPDADEREVKERLLKNWMPNARTELLVVQINPLTQEQIKTYAQHRGIIPPEQFIAEVARCHAWSFVRRPVDAEDLIQYWLAKRRLGTLTELIEFNIGRNIVPTEKDRNRALAEDRARFGVETLAAATVLCKNLRFRCPPGSREDTSAMEAIDCLAGDWTAEEVHQLLSLPIFDGANYGCVRFHHRRSAEYLAAQWVRRCMENGCSLLQLRGLFFEEIHSKWELRTSLAPVVAWLCLGNYPWNREVRSWVLQSAPDIHWSHGDPSALDVEYRREILQELVRRYSARKRLWLDSDKNSLERFADVGLVSDISRWIKDGTISEDLRTDLIRLVCEGNLHECGLELAQLALDQGESENIRIYALIGIRDLKVSGDVLSPLLDHIKRVAEISQREGLFWVEALYPGSLSPQDALSILDKIQWREEDDLSRFYLLSRGPSAEARKALLRVLVDSLPHPWSKDGGTVTAPSWKTKLIEDMAEHLYEADELVIGDTQLIAEALYGLYWLAEREICHEPNTIWQYIKMHPAIRRSYYWLCWERRGYSRWTPYNQMMNIDLDVKDLVWLLEDVKKTSDVTARRYASETAAGLLLRKGSRREIGRGPCYLLLHYPALMLRTGYYDLRGRWIRFKWKRTAWRWRRLKEKIKTIKVKLHNICLVNLSIMRIRRGRADGLLCNLIYKPYYSSGGWDDLWMSLRRAYGRHVVWAIRGGSKRLWRKYNPPYGCEMEQPGHPLVAYGGLVGIHASIEAGELDVNNLSSQEAETLFRYAMRDWNGVPDWYEEFLNAQRSNIAKQIAHCLEKEWVRPNTGDIVFDMFRCLEYDQHGLAQMGTPVVVNLLEGGDPTTQQVLEAAWRIILNENSGASRGNSRVAALVARKIQSYAPGSKAYALSLLSWLFADLGGAMDYLEAQEKADAVNLRKQMRSIYAEYGGHSDGILFRLWRNGNDCLNAEYVRYLHLLYRSVHPADDGPIPHGCFSPGEPWLAQEYRSRTFAYIGEGTSAAASSLLQTLATDDGLVEYREWFVAMLEKQMRNRADQQAWEPRNIAEYASAFATSPKNDYDLYRIACDRLYDIKYWVELSDMSPRKEVRSSENETVLRAWLARKMSESNMVKYDIAQESVLDQEQRRDIRISHPKAKGPVTIEIKKADEWSGNKLFERLENQLFGQYLRDPDARYGVYMLGYFGSQRHWQHDGRDLSWGGLIVELQSRADELARIAGKGGEVRVVGIDFRAPS